VTDNGCEPTFESFFFLTPHWSHCGGLQQINIKMVLNSILVISPGNNGDEDKTPTLPNRLHILTIVINGRLAYPLAFELQTLLAPALS